MARQIISFGSGPGTQTGDTAYVGGQKINSNFEELYTMVDVLTRLDIIDTAKGFSISGTNVTVNADWIWVINNSQYTNPDAVVLAVNLSSTGMIRKVYVVPNSSNGFNLVEGEEVDDSVTDPPTPELPYGGMYVTYFNVTDTVIGSPAATNNGDSLSNKLDKGSFYGTADDLLDKNTYSWTNVNTLSGVVVDYVNTFTGMSINFKDAVTELHSLSFPTVAKRPYFGALGFIKNSQTIDILIPHKKLSLVANRYCFAFPNEQDLVLKPNEILFFKADPDETHSYGYLDAIGVGFNDNDLVHKTGNETIDGNKSFLQPVSGVTATAGEHLVTKAQMDSAISTETTRATTAETTLQTNIDAEETARIAADASVITTLRDGVSGSGDTLQKLYNLIVGSFTEISVADITARNAYNAPLGGHVFVSDDGDGKWALYKATTSGVNATYVKLSDPDLLNAVMTASQIKTAYESNPDTNAFTNSLLAKLNAVDQNVSAAEKATWNAKQDALAYTAENAANKSQDIEADKASTTKYGSVKAIYDWAVAKFQAALVSGTNIKTINGSSILGSGNLTVGSAATNTDALPEGSTNLYFTPARVLATVLTGISFVTGGAIVSTDSILVAFGKLQKQINDLLTAVGLKQDALVSGTNIKTINGSSILGSGDMTISSGGGDMTTTTDQTVSGIKTFLAGKLGLRNVANTFTSFFTNTNTASRTYTLPDKNGTVAMTSDLPTNTVATGTQNKLLKYTNSGGTQAGNSRIQDTGVYIGIDTISPPTKDLTLGNQSDKQIAIEDSFSNEKGRNLSISAGRTVNFLTNANLFPQSQTLRNWYSVTITPSGDVYACTSSAIEDIYKQTGGVGSFTPLAEVKRAYKALSVNSSGNVYACVDGGDIYKQTGGVGSFVAMGQTSRAWAGILCLSNGNVYACVDGGDIYKQTGGVGSFVAMGQTSRAWRHLCQNSSGDVYACVYGGDIYKQTGGVGSFTGVGTTARNWQGITVLSGGDVYASVYGGDIYKQTAGVGGFVAINSGITSPAGLASNEFYLYAMSSGSYGVGDIFRANIASLGLPNLNGGALSLKAGTGKGTGQSRIPFYTGQKTTSGTDMQVETLRGYFDENGFFVHLSTPVYANDAAADADTNLPSGAHYKITGSRQLFQKP